MNINYGLLPPLEEPATDGAGRRPKGKERGIARKRALSGRALSDLEHWLSRRAAAAE